MIKRLLLLPLFSLLLSFSTVAQSSDELQNAFDTYANMYTVPVELLKAVSYSETRFQHIINGDEHQSCAGVPHVYGIMGLRNDHWFGNSLTQAAFLINASPEAVMNDYNLNIKAAAAYLSMLADMHGAQRNNLNSWKTTLEVYSGIPQEDIKDFYSFEVFNALHNGAEANGLTISAHPQIDMSLFPEEVNPQNKLKNINSIQSDDYGPAIWDPSPNFTNGAIQQQFSVVHTTEGNFANSLSWLKNPTSQASSHYIIRSSDGYIVQLVREANRAWHARCWNAYMLGVEHEAYVSNPSWYTDQMHITSAALYKHFATKFNIPVNRNRVIGHYEHMNLTWRSWMNTNYPHIDPTCNTHTDPGQYWDWEFFFQLINQDQTIPAVLSHTPAGTDSVWANSKIKIKFTQRMDKQATQAAFQITPAIAGTFTWEDMGRTMVFSPNTLYTLAQQYNVTLSSSAKNYLNNNIPANYTFSFVTRSSAPLNVISAYPANNAENMSTSVRVVVKFDTPLLQSSISGNVQLKDLNDNNIPIRNVTYTEINGQGILSFTPQNNLEYDKGYKAIVKDAIKNIVNTPLGTDYIASFRTGVNNWFEGVPLDNFEVIGEWKHPTYSGSTIGVEPNLTKFEIVSEEFVNGNNSGKLSYYWTGAAGVCRVFNSARPNVGSNSTHKVGLWIYGDLSQHLVELWFYYNTSSNTINKFDTLNYTGWKYVQLPVSAITGSGNRLFHSLVLKQVPSGLQHSAIYVDGLQVLDPATVPVELTSFTYTVSGKNVQLNWTTATELNNYGFEVERSSDDAPYVTVAFVKGSGSSSEPLSYSYTDTELFTGKYSYRLKMVDLDGSYEYSRVVNVDVNAPETYSLSQNYPNPFNPSTTINFALPVKGYVTLTVYDALGTEVALLVNEVREPGAYDVKYDASHLSSGIYFYSIKVNDFVQTNKMMLLK